ncbi:unnamed protein product [Symbiodinium microadriaticum]|nr:unnamed protein product [Symbiodinium sp. KB8]CAE7234195.1 unnamed protein product [Symbiodinium microadriaticum]
MLLDRRESLTDSEVEPEVPARRPSTPKKPKPSGGVCAAEFFAGSARLSSALTAVGVPCESFDLKLSTEHDFSNAGKVRSMLQKVVGSSSSISYAHFAPPCNSYSIARWPKLRSKDYPEGLPASKSKKPKSRHQQAELCLANRIVNNTADMMDDLMARGVPCSLENPNSSLPLGQAVANAIYQVYSQSPVMRPSELRSWYGCEYKKRTVMLVNTSILDPLEKRRKSSGTLETPPDVSKAFVLFPGIQRAIETFESWWREHQDVEGIMKALWPDPDSQQAWVMKLDQLFPPEDGVQYLQAEWGDHGLKNLRPWHWGWTKACGNKGTVTKENFLYLLQSVMAKGLVTDTLEAGIELPLIMPARPTFHDDLCSTVTVKELAPAFSVHEIKGWTRVTAMYIAVAAAETAGILDDYVGFLKATGKLHNFQTQVANYMNIPEGKDEIDINRDVTLVSVLSRSKPNCFTYVHQIDKRVQLFDYDPRQQLNAFKEAAAQFNLSRGESDAVENLLLHISPASREMLTKMSSTFGMVRGPISHSGIASRALRNNFHRESGIAFYEDKLGNAEGTVELILSRVYKDYINTAVGLRTSASDEKVQQLQKICRMFQLFLEQLATRLSQEVFSAERPNLVECFMSGSFDDELLEQAEKLPVPLDCAALAEFRHLTQRAANQLRNEELRKKKELQTQVDKASIQSLTEQMTQDVEALKTYDKSLAEAKELWGDMVQSYKRNRRNKGLARVEDIMNTRLSVQVLEVGPNGGFKSIPKHYGLFKNGAAKDMDLKDIVDADTKIEDALLSNSLNPEYHMTAVFDVTSLHGGKNHWTVDKVPLVSHKDMRLVPHADAQEQGDVIGVGDRMAQMGPKGWKHIISQLCLGRKWSNKDDPTRHKAMGS